MDQRCLITRQQFVEIDFQPCKELGVTNQAIFDHLSQTGLQFAVRQGIKRRDVGQHQLRLIERTNHVLAERMIDCRLAANRGIHLREQRRGNLDEWHATLIAGRREPAHVADHTAAQSNQNGTAFTARTEQGIEYSVEGFPGFELLAIRQNNRQHLNPSRRKR
jgi:hypothetical protein